MGNRSKLIGLVAVMGLLSSAGAALAHPAGLPAQGVVSAKNMQWINNQVSVGGNAMDFFEQKAVNGTITRYAVAATHAGFDVIDITDAAEPVTVGRYTAASQAPTAGEAPPTVGLNNHPWITVNPRRQIVAYSIEAPGTTANHGVSNGIDFVDISDVANPAFLGQVGGLGASSNGPHTIRFIDDNYLYTTLPTHIVDYSDPTDPKDLGLSPACGHEFYPDPNIPGRTYVGFCGTYKWGILDTSDAAHPTTITTVTDLDVKFGHEVYPSPDSSMVGVTDYRIGPATGYSYLQCPGGGIHFYDISGKYIPGASLTNPKKLGAWFAPFNGIGVTPDSNTPNWGSCTTHSWQFAPERMLFVAGVYTAGSFVADPTQATKSTGGLYTEWSGEPEDPTTTSERGLGPTTWANTIGNFLAEGDFVNASQWLPFDAPGVADAGRFVFTNGLVRGFDILKYTGPLPKKLSRLTISSNAAGGVVNGKLDRYAVLTYDGWANLPLAGKTVEVSAGGVTVTTTTSDDGSFSVDLGLPPGTNQVTVTWPGDDEFQTTSVTSNVQA